MDRHQDPELRDSKLQQLIEARAESIRLDIKHGRVATIRAVEDAMSHDVTFQGTLVRTTVMCGRSVGYRVEEAVDRAISIYAEELAELDLRELQRANAEANADAIVERAIWAREAA
jgi:hypothetical protein